MTGYDSICQYMSGSQDSRRGASSCHSGQAGHGGHGPGGRRSGLPGATGLGSLLACRRRPGRRPGSESKSLCCAPHADTAACVTCHMPLALPRSRFQGSLMLVPATWSVTPGRATAQNRTVVSEREWEAAAGPAGHTGRPSRPHNFSSQSRGPGHVTDGCGRGAEPRPQTAPVRVRVDLSGPGQPAGPWPARRGHGAE